MPSFEYVIDERSRAGSRFLSRVRDELQRALLAEKAGRKLTQQSIADKLGVNRSVVNRQFMGLENLTARTIGELLWAIGWEAHFEAVKPETAAGANEFVSVKEEIVTKRPEQKKFQQPTKPSSTEQAHEFQFAA